MQTVDTTILENNISKASIFEGKSLGRILLFPSQGRDKVSIFIKTNKPYYGNFSDLTIGLFCLIPAEKRSIILGSHDYYDHTYPTLDISTPELLYGYTYDLVDHNGHNMNRQDGFFYIPNIEDDNKDSPLSECFERVTHFFFPHVYFNGHLCYNNLTYSPRSLYNNFWSSKFSRNWYRTYGRYNNWSPGNEAEARLVIPDSPKTYQEHQDKSNSPKLDKDHRITLSKYEKYFELTKEKPIGVFMTTKAEILQNVSKETYIKHPDGRPTCVLGFAFYRNQEYWVWLNNNEFLRFKPEQLRLH